MKNRALKFELFASLVSRLQEFSLVRLFYLKRFKAPILRDLHILQQIGKCEVTYTRG